MILPPFYTVTGYVYHSNSNNNNSNDSNNDNDDDRSKEKTNFIILFLSRIFIGADAELPFPICLLLFFYIIFFFVFFILFVRSLYHYTATCRHSRDTFSSSCYILN